MKKVYPFLVFLLFASSILFMGYSSGPATAVMQGYTGAPNETGTRCITCHSSTANFGSSTTSITVFEVGGTTPLTEYVPGTTYEVHVVVSHPMGIAAGYGFQCVALNTSNVQAGTFSNARSNVKFASGTMGNIYAEHNGTSTSNTFIFDWTAPLSFVASGNVGFYAAGNVVDGLGGTAGDSGTGGAALLLTESSLPISLVNFTANPWSNEVLLNWETETEVDNQSFEIEHSVDGQKFEKIATIAGAGNSEINQKYQFVHRNPQLGVNNYYRLKQIDFSGDYTYSHVVVANLRKMAGNLAVITNQKDQINISLEILQEGDYELLLYNQLGQLMHKELVYLTEGSSQIQVPVFNWSTGVYIVHFTNWEEKLTQQFFLD